MRIVTWNVNGLRAIAKKDFFTNLATFDADVICLQETKAQPDEVVKTLEGLDEYQIYCNSALRKGYSSTAMLCREAPLQVCNDMQVPEHDEEGRLITAEYADFYLVASYVPNSGRGLVRLEYRQRWDRDLLGYLQHLEATKPVVLCGDLNVAHQPIDLANPKSNYNKTAGYTQAEIDGFEHLLDAGFVDVFRVLHPDKVQYTWWSYMLNARARNIGWRIDYFLASAALMPRMARIDLLNDTMGSDHCPVLLELM